MTDKQRLNALRRAMRELKHTTQGFNLRGSHWAAAWKHLHALEDDLAPKARVPALGPVVPGGVSVLLQDCTHITGGLPDYPAFDDGWVAGRSVIAPEDLVVTRQSSAQGGDAFYATGASKIRWWFGHVDNPPATGKKFRKGDAMAKISADHPRPHVHVGLDVVPLTGKPLISHTNYTHGAPKIGVQLSAALGEV